MSNDENEEVGSGFKVGADEDELGEPLDMPEDMPEFELDEEDPDRDK